MKKAIRRYYAQKIIPFPDSTLSIYPGAADRQYYIDKAVDYAFAAITSLGTVVALAFLFLL